MDDSKAMSTILQAKLKPLVREDGFTYQRPTLLVRERDNVLHLVNLHVRSHHVVIDYALQPLYIEASNFYLTCGDRLDRFVNRELFTGWGEGDRAEFQNDCDEISLLLENEVFPMFQKYGTPSGLIGFIENDVWRSFTQGFPPEDRYQHAAYSYWYLGDIDGGIRALSQVFDCGLDTSQPWIQTFLEIQRELLRIAREQPELLSKKLDDNIQLSKSRLRLK